MLQRSRQAGLAGAYAVLDLKREYLPLHQREIVTICWACFGYRLGHTTVHSILAEIPPALRSGRLHPPDSTERLTIGAGGD